MEGNGIGHIAASDQLLAVTSPSFPVSAIKRAEDGDGVIVRVYNISDGEAETLVNLKPVIGDVTLTDLNEDPVAEVPRVHGGVPLTARPNQIMTLRFERDD